jgi:uncharacterized protein (TIGR03000 family)
VTVPEDAIVAVDGVPVKQTGPERRLITPPFEAGETGKYTLTATFVRDGKTITVERTITVEGGKVSRVDLTQGAPAIAPKKQEPKKVDPPKKEEPKKVDPPKKEEPKKVDPPKKEEPKKVDTKLDVPYFPTPQKVVEEMLKLASVKENDVVLDLGSGDGRIPITAVKSFKAKKAIGVELYPDRVKLSRENATKAGVADKLEIREGDILKIKDASEASVVTLYLLPEVNAKLKPMLRKTLKPGSRVVSHDFDMGNDWKPEKEITVKDDEGKPHVVYLWTIPDEKPAPKKEEPKAAPKKEEPKRVDPPKKEEPKKEEPRIKLNAPYVPTPQSVVEEMLKFAGVKEGDVVYDLGCGDGRIVITAVKSYKAKKGVGIDLDPERIADSNKAAKDAKVENKVEFREADVLKLKDVSEATVVTLYLFPEINEKLRPMLQKTLKPGSRIVSHDFLMGDEWKPEKEVTVKDANGDEHTIYLWTVK